MKSFNGRRTMEFYYLGLSFFQSLNFFIVLILMFKLYLLNDKCKFSIYKNLPFLKNNFTLDQRCKYITVQKEFKNCL